MIKSNYPTYGNPNGKNIHLISPIENADEPFCFNGPFLMRSNTEELHNLLFEHFNDEIFNDESFDEIEENNNIDFFGTVDTTLLDMVDYHNFIGNQDCPLSVNEILVHLHKMAEDGLK